LEAWEKVVVHSEFLESVHNVQNCIGCHGGVDETDDKDAAHEGMVRDPLEQSDRMCGVCHAETTESVATSLHQTLAGYQTVLTERGADFDDPGMSAAWDNHCTSCHTTCGQCHISRPTYHGGGVLNGHEVKEVASMRETCIACHGARVADEYQGKNEGVEGSTHWLEEAMPCYECHDTDQYHGDGTTYASRYDGAPSVACLECHPEATPEETTVQAHEIHSGKVDCYVCHVSGPYKNCYDCHVALDDKGLPYYETAESEMAFKIGYNPLKSEDRPWDYALVRHVPVVSDTFAFYGDDLLPTFDNLPTWKYATPHNIQRVTPQNQSCDSCHDNPDAFLLAEDVRPEEMQANATVIIDEVPTLAHPGLGGYDIPEACVGCHPKALEWDWELLSDAVHSLDYVVEPAGTVILCEDCHSPEGSFDWAGAGYSDEEAEALTWASYPVIEPVEEQAVTPSSGLYWVLGLAVVIAAITVVPVIGRRNDR
jgi:thiosulfate/3-mercaptopyruvate sulfurtransferase